MLIDFATHPVTEILAVLAFLVYVVLSAKGNIWCWGAGFVTSFLYTFIFLGAHLTAQVTLNVLYMIMAVWGWSAWLENAREGEASVFGYWHWRNHLMLLPVLIILILISVYWIPSAFQPNLKYLDASITIFSIVATVLTIYRRIESWLYWIAINGLTFVLYQEKGLNQTAMLAIFNTAISIYGFVNWHRFRAHDQEIALQNSNAQPQ